VTIPGMFMPWLQSEPNSYAQRNSKSYLIIKLKKKSTLYRKLL